ncbi:caffeoyl-CoA O-methyltransferase [Stackebrandtia albiflava]|uniref:Caffeoyl-CoA O-methyltransferase n=1 Tax=Stackebrandtia albiflava TaxID=406432 RepID=A0A562UYB7_9ACTN|nr:class I SAM-dependent methyltransferase [Stackebrandtia albiflava]TWJ10605.1 caffeoyl-CoA O-methyltransferase [Stackebrandtia albiflava]
MSRASLSIDARLHEYLVTHGTPPDPLLRELIEETRKALPERAGMQIGPEQAAFTTLLTRLIGARRAVEVGTFTGMSSLAIARGLPDDGRLTCFDISDEFTSIARRYWERDGQAGKIELRIGDARKELRSLPEEPHLDLAFIDADKPGYAEYWEQLVPRVRPGGLIAVDNVLWSGRVADPAIVEDQTEIIRRFNTQVVADDRVEQVMLPIGDGLTLARRL